MSAQSDRLLRTTLNINAVFTALSGFALVLFAAPLARLLTPATAVAGLPVDTILMLLGAGLVLFGLAAGWIARGVPISMPLARAIFWADVAWVAGTVLLLLAAGSWFSLGGLIAVIAVGLVVADFATFEYLGLRRLRAA